jgi:hypothetical protein
MHKHKHARGQIPFHIREPHTHTHTYANIHTWYVLVGLWQGTKMHSRVRCNTHKHMDTYYVHAYTYNIHVYTHTHMNIMSWSRVMRDKQCFTPYPTNNICECLHQGKEYLCVIRKYSFAPTQNASRTYLYIYVTKGDHSVNSNRPYFFAQEKWQSGAGRILVLFFPTYPCTSMPNVISTAVVMSMVWECIACSHYHHQDVLLFFHTLMKAGR